MLNRSSLKIAIMLLTVLAIGLTSATTVFFSVREYQSLFLESAGEDLNALSDNLSSDLIPILANGPDLFQATNILLRLEQYEAIEHAAIIDRRGEILAQYTGKAVPNRESLDADTAKRAIDRLVARAGRMTSVIEPARDALIVRKRIGDASLPLGTLIISTDVNRALAESTARLLSNVASLVVTSIAILLVIIFFMISRLTQPLQQLDDFTREIQDTGDYSMRAPVKGTREIADLTVNFNNMMGSIYQEMEKNRVQYDQLMSHQEQMQVLNKFDVLTGLANRTFMRDTLQAELASAEENAGDLAVLYVDLDGFEPINDIHGHEVGDRLLEQVGSIFRGALRESDLAARLGGDEFLVVLDQKTDLSAAEQTANQLIEFIGRPKTIAGVELKIGASIGIATARSAHYEMPNLISRANNAMRQAKASGGNQCMIFHETKA
ncbi:MAG: diguanylate cyclase [Halieaceae bacterium]|jgi:diguanylate cyclase (GGDEF)-like protein|nr:diguanylate cyclase [Halieaceae bacterium]